MDSSISFYRMEKRADYYLYPGTVFASKKPYVVSTVLGSCIAVCLFDPVTHCGGINHFMLPLCDVKGCRSLKYGNIAINKLIDKMVALGCEKANLKAKIFGGSQQFNAQADSLRVGEQNIVVARQMLEEQKIHIINASTGGVYGRKLYFYTDTGVVMMKLIN